jgi:hypothetical protein
MSALFNAHSISVLTPQDTPAPGAQYSITYPAYIGYVSIDAIHPGQLRYASKNVDQKVKEAIKREYAKKVEGQYGYVLKFDNGRSTLAETSPLPVIIGPYGFILVDGHHDLIAALQLGAKTIPVKVLEDLSKSSDFWRDAEKKNYVYMYDLDGKRKKPPYSFTNKVGRLTLKDDPNRYFAAIVARKCDKRGQLVEESKGSDYPLWIKIGKDIPFIEFRISDFMNKAGLQYSYTMGDTPSREFVNKVREALKKNPIQGLKLIEQETFYKDIYKDKGGLCNLPDVE